MKAGSEVSEMLESSPCDLFQLLIFISKRSKKFWSFFGDRIVIYHSWPTGGAVSQGCLYETLHLFPICFAPQTMKKVNRWNQTCLSFSENCKQKPNECCLREIFGKCGRSFQTETAPVAAIDRPDWWHVGSKKQTRIWCFNWNWATSSN